jgi:trk system potassium uptake protein TrkH
LEGQERIETAEPAVFLFVLALQQGGTIVGSRNGFLSALTPFQLLVLGYALVTLTGAFLLSTPIATRSGEWQNALDALFVATSGISTTGLTPVDVGNFYTLFGQIVLLCVFQIGGLGYMAFIIFFASILRMRTSLVTEIVARESLAGSTLRTLGRFFLATVVFALGFEVSGVVVLTMFWLREYPFWHSLYFGVFHSVSAFCTAGFGLLPDSLMKYRDNVLVNTTINLVSLAGGIGFFVLYEMFSHLRTRLQNIRPARISVHTKLVITVTVVIVAIGALVILITERWDSGIALPNRVMISAFQAISASTTDGFNSVDIGKLGWASLTVIMLLMFVGASPGSTGGGIKTSTMGILLAFLSAQLEGREDAVSIYKRQIPVASVYKALGVFAWFAVIVVIDMAVMAFTETATYERTLFEIVSALGNTGLSTGITSRLSTVGKVLLIVTMFIGRVGPLTVGFFIVGRRKPALFRYAEEDVFVG